MREFPKAVQQMGAYGMQGVKAFIKALDFSHAQDQLGQQLKRVENDFADVQKAVTDTSGTIEDKSAAAIRALLGIEKDGTGPMRAQAKQDIHALRQQAIPRYADSNLRRNYGFAPPSLAHLAIRM